MMDKIIKLHLGAHKTASTYIQDLLDCNRGLLASHGVTYWPLHVLRPKIRHLFEFENACSTNLLYRLRVGNYDKNVIEGRVRGLFDNQRHVIISDENILGGCGGLLNGKFYPDVESRLKLLARTMPDWPIEIWLSIRRYDDFFSSVYGEGLRGGSFVPLEDFLACYAKPHTYWSNLIERIQCAIPRAKIIVWDFAVFRKLEGEVIEGITGLSRSSLQYQQDKLVRQSASAKAIHEAASSFGPLSRTQRLQQILALEHQYPLGEFPPFRPWQKDESDQLFEAFNAEIKLIKQLTGIRYISQGSQNPTD